MNTLPKRFESREIEVDVGPFGKIGILKGVQFHYPDWFGLLEPAPAIDDKQEEIRKLLDEDEILIQLRDLISDEVWSGTMSSLRVPAPDCPWYELRWYDGKKPLGYGSTFLEHRLLRWIWRLLSGAPSGNISK